MQTAFHIVGVVILICASGFPSGAVAHARLPGEHQDAEVLATQHPKEKLLKVLGDNSEGKDACVGELVSRTIDSKAIFETGESLSNCQRQPTEVANPVDDSADPLRKEAKSALTAGWNRYRPFLRHEGGFEVSLNGYIQLDWKGYPAGFEQRQTLLVRRARLGVDGKIRSNLDFKIQFDFSNPKLITLKDAYLKVYLPRKFQLSVGHMKAPFSQEELLSDSALDFVENSVLNNLANYRSLGITLSGSSVIGNLDYQLGVFNGSGKFTRMKEESPEGFVRLRFAPWKNSNISQLKKLAIGGALAHSLDNRSGESIRGRSDSRSFVFFKADKINGKITRANAELAWLSGPAAFRTEYDQTNQERVGLGPGGENLPSVVSKGYMAQFTYLLTGETKVDSKTVAPKNDFMKTENGSRGFGAWELKMRYANLQINDSTAKSNRADSVYFGLNWYLNQNVRYVLDFGRERFKDPLRTPNVGQGSLFVVLSRIQLAF